MSEQITHYLVAIEVGTTAWGGCEIYTGCSLERKRDKRFEKSISGNLTWEDYRLTTDPQHVTCLRCKRSSNYKGA